MLSAMARVVVLNGTSSSGKTSVARAFQDLAPSLFLNFSIDSILQTLPPKVIARMQRSEEISDLRYPELARAYHACVRELLSLGHDLITDNAITARYQAELLVDAIAGHDVLLVGLDCRAAVLREREASRGDRRSGLAAQQLSGIHAWLEYDVMLDSAVLSPEESAAEIARLLESGARGALSRLRAKLGTHES
jgi:chloramphenicol 3-O phosphotransferase